MKFQETVDTFNPAAHESLRMAQNVSPQNTQDIIKKGISYPVQQIFQANRLRTLLP